jgi:hypothetical protein
MLDAIYQSQDDHPTKTYVDVLCNAVSPHVKQLHNEY